MSEDIQTVTAESEIQAPQILKRSPGRPKKNFVASPEQKADLEAKIKFHEAAAQGAISAKGERMEGQSKNFYSPQIPGMAASHKKEAEKLKADLMRVSPIEYTDREKDEDYKLAMCIKEKFREIAPTVDEMNHATGANIRKNQHWLYRRHDFRGNMMTGDQAQLLFQKIMRTIDPDKSVLEDFRKGR